MHIAPTTAVNPAAATTVAASVSLDIAKTTLSIDRQMAMMPPTKPTRSKRVTSITS